MSDSPGLPRSVSMSQPRPAFCLLPCRGPERPGLGLLLLFALLSLVLSACTTIKRRSADRPVAVQAGPDDSHLLRLYHEAEEKHNGLTGCRILTYGPEALVARAAIVDSATRTLDLQYYIYDPDKVGYMITQRLLEAADRGVRVRLLLDDNNQGNDRPFAILASHPNIEVRIFNPFRIRARWLRLPQYLFDLSRINRRMHNKVIVADNLFAVLGGRNIGDNYYGISESSNFRDFDLLMAGPLARKAGQAFEEYWNSPWAVPVEELIHEPIGPGELEAYKKSHAALVFSSPSHKADYQSLCDTYLKGVLERPDSLVWAKGELFWDPPTKVDETTEQTMTVARRFSQEMLSCKSQCLIEAGYFIPGDDGMQKLRALRGKNVEITVLTSALEATDQPLVYSAYQRYRRELLDLGVSIYEYKLHVRPPPTAKNWFRLRRSPSSLHSKVLVFDDHRSWIGSFNFDARSVNYNTEIAALIDSPELAAQFTRQILDGCRLESSWHTRLERDKNGKQQLLWEGEQDGEETVLKKEPARSWWHRARAKIYALIPGIEHLL